MDKKKLSLKQLKVKSFVTVMDKAEQKTTKGGFIDMRDQFAKYKNNWTTIKTQKVPFDPAKGKPIRPRR